jgi:hypothetical protein
MCRQWKLARQLAFFRARSGCCTPTPAPTHAAPHMKTAQAALSAAALGGHGLWPATTGPPPIDEALTDSCATASTSSRHGGPFQNPPARKSWAAGRGTGSQASAREAAQRDVGTRRRSLWAVRAASPLQHFLWGCARQTQPHGSRPVVLASLSASGAVSAVAAGSRASASARGPAADGAVAAAPTSLRPGVQ